ncbi:uncharacterized protein LOC120534226 [Polypterus senegalus]|uniref:uncharacterized protein LOC120534226 n=1 Tax=Polypterus senegalus TaxID=55291 RepID=UPI001962AFE2|nr:uncharacterized protein LOC120534226 [Polypterus senegalus]
MSVSQGSPFHVSEELALSGSDPDVLHDYFHGTLLILIHEANWLCVIFMYVFKLHCCYSIDGAKDDGSVGRMINDNHKSPNCKIKKLAVDGMPHLCLFALRDILPGEEITYSYGDGPWPWRKQGKEKATIVSSPLQTNDKGTGERDVAQSQILAQQPTLAQVKGTLAIDEQNPDGREKTLSHSLAEKTSEPQEKEAVITNEQTEDNSGSDTEPVSLEKRELDCTVPKLKRSDSVIVSEEMLQNCSESSDSSMNHSDDDYIPKSSEESSPDCSSDCLSAHMNDKIEKVVIENETSESEEELSDHEGDAEMQVKQMKRAHGEVQETKVNSVCQGRKRVKRTMWKEEERRAVEKHLAKFINICKVPGKRV